MDTADFLASGLQHVASRMTYIFDRLRALERTVILFDEVFFLDGRGAVLCSRAALCARTQSQRWWGGCSVCVCVNAI